MKINLVDVSVLIMDRIIYIARLNPDGSDVDRNRIEELLWLDRKVKELCMENSL